jgi:hypothetical protein
VSPLRKLMAARERVAAVEQALRAARHAEDLAAAELASAELMGKADTVRPPPHDKYAGKLPHQVAGWQP